MFEDGTIVTVVATVTRADGTVETEELTLSAPQDNTTMEGSTWQED